MGYFTTFTNKEEIRTILDFFMKLPKKTWIAAIYDGKNRGTYEGACPISASTTTATNPLFLGDGDVKVYQLSNMDSNYQRTIGTVNLNDIAKVELLPSMIPDALKAQLVQLRAPVLLEL